MKTPSMETIEYIQTTARLVNQSVFLKSKNLSWYLTDKEPAKPYYCCDKTGKVEVIE